MSSADPHPSTPGGRWARGAAALGVLALFAAPSWPGTVDDVYITLAYARQWAEGGALQWTTGERVEGYSNFLFLAMMAGGALLGLDIDLAAQIVALLAGAAVVLFLDRLLPRTPTGTVALLAAAAWAPFGHWSAIGMETTLYTALLAFGWVGVLGGTARRGWGFALLVAASVTRPEGILHLVAGGTALALRPGTRAQPLTPALVSLVVLAVYHAVRVAWFGAFVPTSFLVKVSPIGLTRFGAVQLAGDLLSAGGLAVALVAAGRARRADAPWILVPLALQAATLIRASGDWMSWGRLTLPGVLASAAVFGALATPRASTSRGMIGAVVVLAGLSSMLEPRGYGTIDLRPRSLSAVARSVGHLRHGLDTPVAEDVAWVVDNVPTGAAGLVVDAGMLGDIPGFQLIDMRGLTHRPAALAIAAGRAPEWTREIIADPSRRPAFLRLANWEGEAHPTYEEELVGPYRLRAELLYGGGSIRWYATTDAVPTPAERSARWDEVLRRHPSHPFLHWRAALSAAETGDAERATFLAARGAARWPSVAELSDAPESLSFTRGTRALVWEEGRGFEVRCGESLQSRRIAPGESVHASVRSDAPERTGWLSDPCAPEGPTLASVGTTRIPTCPTARSVTFTAECTAGDGAKVFVQLVAGGFGG